MRGRTLSDAFVILDEAQNATREQLKMFLTRLGANSKMVVNGDDTQVDLPRGARSGLVDVERLFCETEDVGIVGELVHPIRHSLIARTNLELSRLETVLSHPHATHDPVGLRSGRGLPHELLAPTHPIQFQSTVFPAVSVLHLAARAEVEKDQASGDASGDGIRTATTTIDRRDWAATSARAHVRVQGPGDVAHADGRVRDRR